MTTNNKIKLAIIIGLILLFIISISFEFFLNDLLPKNSSRFFISFYIFIILSSAIISLLLKYKIYIRLLFAISCIVLYFIYHPVRSRKTTLRFYIENKNEKFNELINICKQDSIVSIFDNKKIIKIKAINIHNYPKSRPANYIKICNILDNIHITSLTTNYKYFSFTYFASMWGRYGLIRVDNINEKPNQLFGGARIIRFDKIVDNWYYFVAD